MELDGHLDRVAQVAADLDRELAVSLEAMRHTRDLQLQGLPLSVALCQSGDPAHREAVIRLAQHLIDVLHDYRAETTRLLVDDEGWSITDIARRTGAARQVVARLYHSASGSNSARRVPSPKIRLEPPT